MTALTAAIMKVLRGTVWGDWQKNVGVFSTTKNQLLPGQNQK